MAHNVENLQMRYGVGQNVNLVDAPAMAPLDDPATWINRVGFTITGRSESVNLKGATEGVFAAEDTFIRKSISSQVALRNVVAATSNRVAMLP